MAASLDILKQMALDQMAAKHPNVKRSYLVIPKYSDKTEKGLKQCIKDFVEMQGGVCNNIVTTGRKKDDRRLVRDVLGHYKIIGSVKWLHTSSKLGASDLSLIVAGRPIEVEIKIGKDRQREAQIIYERAVVNAQGLYWIVRSFDEFYNKYLTLFP